MPNDSRLKRRLAGKDGAFDQKEHLLIGIFNWMSLAAYWSQVGALKGVDPTNQRKLMKAAPKPLERPGDKKPKKFLSAPELARALGRGVRVVPVR